jgi:glycosyltransferase involved in cell wall biosynthesis
MCSSKIGCAMKILYLLPVSWGGIPHYTAELANAVSKYANVMVFKPEDSNDRLFSENVTIVKVFKSVCFSRERLVSTFSLDNLKSFFSYKNIRLVEEAKPDIVHFTELYPQSSIFSFLYRIWKRYPVVSTLHATFKSPLHLLDTRNFLYGLLAGITEFTKYLVNSDAIIVHTMEDKKTLIRRGVNPKRIFVIPHGAYELFRNMHVNESGENEENCILFFGYITENKGVEYLIKAVPLISKEIPNIKVIIAGEGKFEKYSKLIDDKTRFEIHNTFVPNEVVPRLFSRAKVVVLPYIHHQGQSGVLNIARTFGKPAIVTRVGDLPNMVEDGLDGLVVPPRDSISLANAIIKLLKNDELRKEMSGKAIEKAKELSWDNIAKMHIKVYGEVLNMARFKDKERER